MPIKIGYDARMIEHSGIGIRIQHILKYWPIPSTEAELYVFGDPSLLNKYEIPSSAKVIPYFAGIYSIPELFGHPQMGQMDLLDIPHTNIPILYIRKSIVTIHDLIPFHFKSAHSSLIKRIYLNLILRIIALFAKKVIAVSKFTATDYSNHFPIKINDIEIIYNGYSTENFFKHSPIEIQSFKKEVNLPTEYLLTSGIGKKHKNFEFLIRNLETAWQSNQLSLPLVIAGMSKELPLELEKVMLKNPDKIFILKHLPYAKLPLVYQGAVLFVYPSLFEGFGFPVLEAQAVGTPVLSSSATVLPEILGTSALFFNPIDDNDFLLKLHAILSNPQEQKNFAKKGEENALKFIWKDSIANLSQFYKKILI